MEMFCTIECYFAECTNCNTNGCSTCNNGFFLHETKTCEGRNHIH